MSDQVQYTLSQYFPRLIAVIGELRDAINGLREEVKGARAQPAPEAVYTHDAWSIGAEVHAVRKARTYACRGVTAVRTDKPGGGHAFRMIYGRNMWVELEATDLDGAMVEIDQVLIRSGCNPENPRV